MQETQLVQGGEGGQGGEDVQQLACSDTLLPWLEVREVETFEEGEAREGQHPWQEGRRLAGEGGLPSEGGQGGQGVEQPRGEGHTAHGGGGQQGEDEGHQLQGQEQEGGGGGEVILAR